MRDLDADYRIEQDTGNMDTRTGAGGAELHLALVLLGIADELFEIIHR